MTNIVEMDKVRDLANGIEAVSRWRRILSVRWLGFIAVSIACVVWLMTVSDPALWRCIAAAGYSLGVLAPVLALWYFTAKSD